MNSNGGNNSVHKSKIGDRYSEASNDMNLGGNIDKVRDYRTPNESHISETEPMIYSPNSASKGFDDPTVSGWFYRVILIFFHISEILFFKNIKISGTESIPKKGAIIFAANHHSALVDPVLIMLHSGRVVKTMGKSTLFRGLGNWLFRALGGIPVYRPMDVVRGEKLGTNTDSFREVNQVLEHGGAFSIFPEGISHTKSSLQEMKYGMAHMALNYLKKGQEKSKNNEIPSLTILPVGISYLNNQHIFRSNLWVFFGQPYKVPAEIVNLYTPGESQSGSRQEDSRKAVRDLMNNISVLIRRLTITAPDWETVELILLAVNIFKPLSISCVPVDTQLPIEHILHVSSVIRKGAVILIGDPIAISLRSKLCLYIEMINRIGLTDDDILTQRELGPVNMILWSTFYIIATAIGFLVCMPVLIWNLPIIIPIWFLSHFFAGTERDTVATLKFVFSWVLFPIVYGIYVGISSWTCAYKIDFLMENTDNLHIMIYIIFFSILLPMVGIAALFIYEAAEEALKHLLRILRINTYKSTLDSVKELRKEIQEVLNAVFALVAPNKVRCEISNIYVGAEFMSEKEALDRLMRFVKDNNIQESSVLIPSSESCQQTDLNSLIMAFNEVSHIERHNLVDDTSLIAPTSITKALAISASEH